MPLAEQFDSPLETRISALPVCTPAFVYDERTVCRKLEILKKGKPSSCRLLYSVKAMSCAGILCTIAGQVDGFSASSLFEYKLAREILDAGMPVHVTSPGLDKTLIGILQDEDYASFNSLVQEERLRRNCRRGNFGIRINPERSYVDDERYDPCRAHSKLGAPLSVLKELLSEKPDCLAGLSGVHIHNNCESRDFSELVETVESVIEVLDRFLYRMQWINLGGGYLVNTESELVPLWRTAEMLHERYGLEVFIEPGKAIVGDAGFLASSVIDRFESHGRMIAVLDTSVNHLSEVFEYQYRPVLLEERPGGVHACTLAGASCLSGDIFGDYNFDRPLEIGDRVTFARVGAYMHVKAHMFNGINLPAVYSIDSNGKLKLHREYTYCDYRNRL